MFTSGILRSHFRILAGALMTATIVTATPTQAASPAPLPFPFLLPPVASFEPPAAEPQTLAPSEDDATAYELPARLRRQVVNYATREAPGTVIIDTPNTYLYYVLGNGQAMRYGIGVGRDGFRWSGVHRITAKKEWPAWTPPAQMLRRRPDLPRHMAGGIENPLGARAMYLGSTLYRIHGSNEPETIGQAVSSGCFRMTNEDVADLYDRVAVGTTVIVKN